MKKIGTTIYKAIYKGDVIAIGKTIDEVIKLAESSYWAEEYSTKDFEYSKIDIELPQVKGVLENWGNENEPNYHVSWRCPLCSKVHDTDVENPETKIAAWFCEVGKASDIVLVTW